MTLFPWILTTAASARWMARTIGLIRELGSVACAETDPTERLKPTATHVRRSSDWLVIEKRQLILGPGFCSGILLCGNFSAQRICATSASSYAGIAGPTASFDDAVSIGSSACQA